MVEPTTPTVPSVGSLIDALKREARLIIGVSRPAGANTWNIEIRGQGDPPDLAQNTLGIMDGDLFLAVVRVAREFNRARERATTEAIDEAVRP